MRNLITILNGLILPMTENRSVVAGFVRMAGESIIEVGEGSPQQIDIDETTLDAGGDVVMPGLINAHTHLYQVLLRAVWEDLPLWPWLKRIYGAAQVLRPEHFYAGSLLGCLEAIKSGVTTICEHNFLNPHRECAFETIRAIAESELRAVFARTLMDTGEIVPDCVKETSEKAFRHIEDLQIAYPENDRLRFRTGPNTPPLNTTPELLRDIRAFADQKHLGISAHVAESKSVVEFTQQHHGKTGIVEFLSEFGIPRTDAVFAHCVHLSKREITMLKRFGTSVSHNPVSNMMLGDGVAPVVEMLRQGVNVALGTDGAASNHSQDLFDTMKAASLLQKVHHQDPGAILPYDVLRMATLGGARALGIDSICGTIEVGKRADLILLNMNTAHNQPVNDTFSQIVHCAKASDVRTVIVNGKVLMQDRVLCGLDEKRVVDRAKKANLDLMGRLRSIAF